MRSVGSGICSVYAAHSLISYPAHRFDSLAPPKRREESFAWILPAVPLAFGELSIVGRPAPSSFDWKLPVWPMRPEVLLAVGELPRPGRPAPSSFNWKLPDLPPPSCTVLYIFLPTFHKVDVVAIAHLHHHICLLLCHNETFELN